MSGIIHSWPIEIDFNRAQIRSRIKETDILDLKAVASYIVFTDGSRYYAKNGSTGMIEYSDTDASNVINYAIGKLQNGGMVFIREGTYIITKPIDLSGKKSIVLMGVSEQYGHVPSFSGTVLKLGASMDAMIKIDNSSWGTGVVTAQNKPCNIVIKNLLLYGNREAGYTAHGIFLNVAGGVVIDGVGIFNFAGAGIYATQSKVDVIKNCSIGGATDDTTHNTTEIGSKWFPNDYGIYLDGVGAHFIIDKCTISHNMKDGIYITNVADIVEDVWIHETGIYWNDGAGVNLDRQTCNIFWFIHILDDIIDENINHGILIQNRSSCDGPTSIYIANTQLIGNGRGDSSKYGIYITSTSGSHMAGLYIINTHIYDPHRGAQQSIYLSYADVVLISNSGFDPSPVITETATNIDISNVNIPEPVGGLPFYTTLPIGKFTGETVLYYDGTYYKICAYLGGAWRCAVLS